MFCTNCGNEIKEGTLFCTECGTPVPKVDGAPVAEPVKTDVPKVAPAPQPTMQVPPTATAPSPKKKGNGPLIAIIILIVALVLGGGAFALVSSGALDDIISGFDSDREDDDEDDDDKDKDDDEDEDDNKGGASAIEDEDTETSAETDAYGIITIDDVNEEDIENVLSIFESYCEEHDITNITLFYYNSDNVPELYCHDTDVLVYIYDVAGAWCVMEDARSSMLVYGYNVTNFVKSENVEDAYLVLTDPNYMLENADYILPTSHTEYLTKEDLAGLTKEQLRIARNEIFARHGRMFDSEDLQEYFNSKDWYTGTIPADEFNLEEILNEYEKANADLIKEVEAEMGN